MSTPPALLPGWERPRGARSSTIRPKAKAKAAIAPAKGAGRGRRGNDEISLATFFGLCGAPPVDHHRADLDFALEQLRADLHEQKEYFEAALETQAKKHSDDLIDLRARLLESAMKKGEASDAEIGELRLELQKLDELDQKIDAMKAQTLELDQKVDAMKAEINELECFRDLRARMLVVPATEAEMDDLRKRVSETEEMLENDRVATRPPPGASGGSASPVSQEEAMKRTKEEDARRKREEELLSRHELFAKHSIMITIMKQELAALGADTAFVKMQAEATGESVKTLREDMHRNIEAVSIKAGYLALALTDNDEEEKRRVHSMLKEKEQALTGSASGLLLYTTVRSEHDAGLGESVDLPTLAFPVVIDRSGGQSLGMKLKNEGTWLRVEDVEDGLAMEYNRTCLPPSVPLKRGDRIVQVNDVKGYAGLLEKEMGFRKELRMVVQRPS